MGKKLKKEVEPPPKDVFDPLCVESKKAATVVLMLNSPEEEVLSKACEALYKFAAKGEENKMTLLKLGAVEPLFKLVTHEDPIVRRNATMVMGIMASHNDVKKLLRQLDVTSAFIARLAPEEDVVIHEFASLCLAHMAVEYNSKVQIFEQGGLEPLIRLLGSPDPDVKKNCVECIYSMVQDFQSRAAVRELNVIPPLLDLLKSDYPIIQLLALKTLGIITIDKETRVMLRENQGLDHLLRILETKEFNDLHVEALGVVANCLEDVETVQLFQETGSLRKLLMFTEVSTLPDFQRNAARAIAKAANYSEIRKIFNEQEVEKCLVTLLRTNSDGTKIAASQAISAMCENLASKQTIGTLGIPQLVQLLSSNNEEVKEAAATALANLTTAHLGNASIVQSRAALVVAAVSCDAEARAKLRNSGGLDPLVKLLHSKDKEVRRNACWAVMVCARDELTAAEMTKLGALDILEEINLSIGRKNNFSEAALDQILDHNLSQKYSQMGYLSCNNIISDGFYDYGQIKPGVKLLSLEELSGQELNDRRAIILINAKLPEPEPTTVTPADERAMQDGITGRIASSGALKKTSKEKASPVEEKSESPARSSSISKGSSREKGSRKGKGKKDEEKPKEEDIEPAMPKIAEEVPEKVVWLPPPDTTLQDYINEVSKTILPLATTKEQVVQLAQFVADKMGGPIERDKLHEFSWELHISEIEYELKCNVVPIGKINRGTFYHRALLFKVLADRIGVSCSLVRGEYNRAWNEVKLIDHSPMGILLLPPRVFIVDLMYEPGHLMKDGSPEADRYRRISGSFRHNQKELLN
ncbi:armadillo repeat-containing protein 3 isoform X2 [Anolis carolinensis]|uniref:armadillo repeat-containing protein 3 isoform X2 n=1 Tax=Anolis carolinensis TaxID=28377 RepID=UPI0007DB6D85|nr:PREDICTED: armadillo repeat-containing protein 3 isoform X3 [Anolis carolinensis]|eukprot:XP_016849785.1 PREDICTED: armadillo repeat-containing protein 3 isoform X3 [Anolis carolinensis]